MTVFTITFLLFLFLIAIKRYGSLACPAVIFYVGWILALFGTMIYSSIKPVSMLIQLFILAGAIIFQLGFDLGFSANKKRKPETKKFSLNTKSIAVFSLIISFPIVIIALKMLVGIMSRGIDQWYTYLISHEAFFINQSVTGYLISLFENYFLVIFAVFWFCEKKHKKWCKKLLFLLSPLVLVCILYNPSRNAFLFFMLTCMFIVIYSLKLSNKSIFLFAVFAVLVFVFYFILISLKKYFYLLDGADDNSSFALEQLFAYLSGGISSFSASGAKHSMTALGSYTFRFIFAIIDKITGSELAVDIVNEFETGSGISTNVFTFYDFYVRDFGFAYALIVQLFVGILHGYFYKGYKNGDKFALFMSAVIIYPLVMQFFQDQYLSIFSSWLQILIISLIVFKTKIFVKQRNKYTEYCLNYCNR